VPVLMPVLFVEDDGNGQHAQRQGREAATENRDEHSERNTVGRHGSDGFVAISEPSQAGGCLSDRFSAASPALLKPSFLPGDSIVIHRAWKCCETVTLALNAVATYAGSSGLSA